MLYMIPDVVGGTEFYARGLVSALKELKTGHEFVLFLNRESSEVEFDIGPEFRRVICPVNARNRGERYVFEQMRLRSFIRQEKIDILHSLGYTSPLFLPIPSVVTVHDLNFKAFGGTMSFARRTMLKLFVKQSVLRSNMIIAASEFSKREILNEYGINREKVVAIYVAVDSGDILEGITPTGGGQAIPSQSSPPYVVGFSSTYANKNIGRLIEAFEEAKRVGGFQHKLVLIGHKFPLERRGGNSQSKDDSGDVVWTGYIDRGEVLRILRGAEFLVFPSYYEGFGRPVLESMAAGVPVLCSNAASLPEVAGNAALYFDPFSVKNMAECIVSAAGDPRLRQELRWKGFENLKRFSWMKTASETMAVYREVLSKFEGAVRPAA